MTGRIDRIVVMGVSGCGKSSIGRALALELGLPFCEGDDLHAAANVAKMAAGKPLDDADRAPWLDRVAGRLAEGPVVVACSALKRRYRDRLRAGAGRRVAFVHLEGSREVIARRMARRSGHFMPPTLLDSQFAALERPGPDEPDIVTVGIEAAPDAIAGAALAGLARLAPAS